MKHLISSLFILALSLNAQVTGLSDWSLFIDPGHSQHENMGVNGYSEAESNLKEALHLKDLLTTKTDIGIVWTSRTNDTELVGLYDRSVMANNLHADWFHSIHSNAPSSTNSTVLLLYGEKSPGVEKTPNGGKAMSHIMDDIMANAMRIPKAGGQGTYGDCVFYGVSSGPYLSVNRNTLMASELSESGHHTVPWQNNRQMNNEHARLVAYSIFWSVLDLKGITRPYPGILTGIVSDIESKVPVNGATIEVNGESYTTDTYESLFYKYTTNPDKLHNGFYYFEDLPDQAMEVIVSAPGYYPDTLQITDMVNNFATFLDVSLIPNTPPIVLESHPAQGDTSYPAWQIPNFSFSRAMNDTSLESAFSVDPFFDGTFYFSSDHKLMAYVPTDTLEFLMDYTITIKGTATDIYDHPLDGNQDGVGGDDWVISFRTGPPDLTAPEITNIYPASGNDMIDLHPVFNIVWDEELDPESISNDLIKLEHLNDLQLQETYLEHHVINNRSVLVLYTTQVLSYAQSYQLRVLSGFTDLFGNVQSSTRTIIFTTPNYGYEVTSIDNFDSGISANWWTPTTSGSTEGVIGPETSVVASTAVRALNLQSTTSMRLNYSWDAEAGTWLIREYLSAGTPRSVTFNSSKMLQAYVFGDGSGNLFRFALDDRYPTSAAENHEVSPWFVVDWYGWRLVSWDMTHDGTGTWLGDGNLDGTLRFDSIQLGHTAGKSTTGTFYIDDLRVTTRNYLALDGNTGILPMEFALLPNYPNPFNPWTTIPFTLPEASDVSVDIYNLKGELIEQVLGGSLEAGQHVTRWNASHVASGIYLVRLSAPGASVSRKITVLK
ncbi:MAG: N-acetylmuramoyl-L-alanine amidase [Candidatus Marinimicrobia bacterium]|nr:N-acetylmuramoyl-L-alanine amidase [Candidatus Neomarinimicrobiota bacterium]